MIFPVKTKELLAEYRRGFAEACVLHADMAQFCSKIVKKQEARQKKENEYCRTYRKRKKEKKNAMPQVR